MYEFIEKCLILIVISSRFILSTKLPLILKKFNFGKYTLYFGKFVQYKWHYYKIGECWPLIFLRPFSLKFGYFSVIWPKSRPFGNSVIEPDELLNEHQVVGVAHIYS